MITPTLTKISLCDCALTSASRIVRETDDDGRASYRSLIHLRGHLGSVRTVIDGDTVSVIKASDYHPFGKRIPLPVASAVSVTEPVEVTKPIEATVASMVGELCRTTSSATVAAAQYAGGKIAARAEEKYSSMAMKSSVRKEVKKEMIRTGVNPAGKAGDVAGSIAAHRISHVIYDKEE